MVSNKHNIKHDLAADDRKTEGAAQWIVAILVRDFIVMQPEVKYTTNICSYDGELQEARKYAASQVVRLIFMTHLKFTLCCDGYLMIIPSQVAPNAFSLKEKQEQKTRLKRR